MLSRFAYGIVAAALLLAGSAVAADEQALSTYRLGAGDTINIQVLGEDDLKRERIRLSDAGTISFPFLGELKVKGITIGELERMIAAGLKGRYLLNPIVNVSILEYRQFFINGQVQKPGGYQYLPGLTVYKAVVVAGGFKERAAQDKIYVIRDADSTQTRRKIDLNSAVNPGDILTIEESFF